MQRIRKGDVVQVMIGHRNDRGKQGRVLAVDAERDRVRVEGVRIQKRHLKPGRRGAKTGGIVPSEGFVHVSNVMLVDPEGSQAEPRARRAAGRQAPRVFVRSGEPVPEPARG